MKRDEKLKSISKETTFDEDTADPDLLDGHLWRLAEQVADRAKAKDLVGPHRDAEAEARRFQPGQPPPQPGRPDPDRRPHLPRGARPVRRRRATRARSG